MSGEERVKMGIRKVISLTEFIAGLLSMPNDLEVIVSTSDEDDNITAILIDAHDLGYAQEK